MTASLKYRHIDSTDPGYTTARTELGWARRRVGGAPGVRAMEDDLGALAPSVGEGPLGKPDPFLGLTIQPDGRGHPPAPYDAWGQRVPPEPVEVPDTTPATAHLRKTLDAFGRVQQKSVDRLPQHDELIAEHLELSYDGDTVSHDRLHDGIAVQSRTSKYLAIVLVVAVAVALLSLSLTLSTRGELGHARRQIHELRARLERLEQAPPAPSSPRAP